MKNKTSKALEWEDTVNIPSVIAGTMDVPNDATIAIYIWCRAQGHKSILWSGVRKKLASCRPPFSVASSAAAGFLKKGLSALRILLVDLWWRWL